LHGSAEFVPADYVPLITEFVSAIFEAISSVAQDTSADLGKKKSLTDINILNEYMILECIIHFIDYLRWSHLNYAYLRQVFDPGILFVRQLFYIIL
jgi:hypothetical protein